MNKNLAVWKWATIVMLLCNMGLMAFVLLRPCPPPPPHGGPHGVDKFIINELELDEQQIAKFDLLKKEHRSKMEKLRKSGRKLRNVYFEQLKNTKENDSLVRARATAIGINQQEIELATYIHFKSLRNMLTETQKEIFDSIIQEVLRRMGPPPKHAEK
ncbi:MAG TPA: hypothetical protein VK177_11830 [Flavobacteriales bacterium]|nr:hypothetical protein [Flavobacteriales bacterium]